MNEATILEYMKATFGPGLVIGAWWVGRILWKLGEKLVPLIIETIAEMKNLRAEMETVKKLGPRVDKLEADVHESYRKIRNLQSETQSHKSNGG